MRLLLGLGSVLGWFALGVQFYLIILNRNTSLGLTVLRYFSYFTILTNLLVALCFTFLFVSPLSKGGKFFDRPSVLTSVAVYISVVGLIYNIVLRPIWDPRGLQMVVDELLHSIIPALYILYWLVFVRPKRPLQWKGIVSWLLYPLIYIVVILILGSLSGFYPYPFVNVNEIGYYQVFINTCFVCLVFLFFSLLFVGLSRIKK